MWCLGVGLLQNNIWDNKVLRVKPPWLKSWWIYFIFLFFIFWYWYLNSLPCKRLSHWAKSPSPFGRFIRRGQRPDTEMCMYYFLPCDVMYCLQILLARRLLPSPSQSLFSLSTWTGSVFWGDRGCFTTESVTLSNHSFMGRWHPIIKSWHVQLS